ncbi:DUF2339 domain-containing protein [Flexivirga caeni]|uniref:DUF2339 domain-containing protein n=1 Tax=Flexivirga caeni TaxID=2294115 RepID=A0A3M9MIG7_9MICO|nr:DUF2339 domain-containing protein [Flexivirga caeni]RNI25294.1 DUF2339 domain-containing protein [Flexivirga caeni]
MNTTANQPGPVPGQPPANPYAAGQHPYAARGTYPGQHPGPYGAPVAPYAMMPRRAPWWQREGIVSKLLVLTGGAITLIGVVMLLVIAAHAGLLSPQVRVAGGAVLSAALIGAGLRVHGRPGGTIGGVALAGTGIAGLFVDTVAVTSFYEWLPAIGGLVIAGAIAAAAAALAVHWRSELLAIGVTIAVAALAPVLTSGVTVSLVWFMVILQAAAIVPERLRGWCFHSLVSPLPAVTVVAAYAVDTRSIASLPAVLAVLSLGAAGFFSSTGKDDELHSAAFGFTVMPAVVQLPLLDQHVALVVGAALTALIAGAAFCCSSLGTVRRTVLAAAALLLGVETCLLLGDDSWMPVLVLVPGVAVAAVSVARKSTAVTLVGAALGGCGAVAYLVFANPAALSRPGLADAQLSYVTMTGGLLLVAWAALSGTAMLRPGTGVRQTVVAPVAVCAGLYGATAAMISFGSTVGGTPGFHSAHLGVTVVWVIVAMASMAFSLHQPRFAAVSLGGGLLLAGGAVAKLFLFDLQEMSGATRAMTFLAVGLVLLLAGSRYAQAFARKRSTGRGPAARVAH